MTKCAVCKTVYMQAQQKEISLQFSTVGSVVIVIFDI